MPKVSILLPTYNAADTLNESLSSLSAQSFTDFEIILVDDGSTDGTHLLLDRWKEREPRLEVFCRAHEGIVGALQNGLAECKGDYVARMDADDLADPERLALQVSYLDNHPEVDLVSCRVSAFPPEAVRGGIKIYIDWLNGLMTHEQISREIFVESPLPHPSVMFRRETVIHVGGYEDHGWPEDYDLWLRMYLAGARFAKVPETLVAWRESAGRLTRADSRYSLENFLRAKAHYLVQGPTKGRDGVVIWGAGMMGRRLSKHLMRAGAGVDAFVDIDPKKVGRTRRGRPIIAPDDLLNRLERFRSPVVLAAVGARGARELIRKRLNFFGLIEGVDWWSVA